MIGITSGKEKNTEPKTKPNNGHCIMSNSLIKGKYEGAQDKKWQSIGYDMIEGRFFGDTVNEWRKEYAIPVRKVTRINAKLP